MDQALAEFVAAQGWTVQEAIGADASARRYHRLGRGGQGGQSAVLMDCRDPSVRDDLEKFITIGGWLRAQGLSAPEIYASDSTLGAAIIEDFGDMSFHRAIMESRAPQKFYALAVDVLDRLAQARDLPELPDFYQSPVHKGRRRVLDWFLPTVSGRRLESGALQGYEAAWQQIESSIPAPRTGFVHVDFHAENLMWVTNKSGLQRCGVLDFQGAMRGPCLYDLANLLWDVRLDMGSDLRQSFLEGLSNEERLQLRMLALGFHCRVIGQFVKLALQGKSGYLQYLPLTARFIGEALADEAFSPLKKFFSDQKLDFILDFPGLKDFNSARVKALIAEDAY